MLDIDIFLFQHACIHNHEIVLIVHVVYALVSRGSYSPFARTHALHRPLFSQHRRAVAPSSIKTHTMSAGDIFLKWIFPLLGGFTGLGLFLSPLKAVLKARRERTLGDLYVVFLYTRTRTPLARLTVYLRLQSHAIKHRNPLPFTTQTANTAGWIAYAYVIAPKDVQASSMIYWPNQVGFILGLFFSVSCYGLARTKVKDRQLAILLFFGAIIPFIGAIGTFMRLSQHGLQLLWGFTSNAILLVYYVAPLSTIITVVKTKSAATLYWPIAVMQIANGGLWTGYGLAISDPFVWAPNAVGACTGCILVTLIVVFRERKSKSSPVPSETDDRGSASSTKELRGGVPVALSSSQDDLAAHGNVEGGGGGLRSSIDRQHGGRGGTVNTLEDGIVT